MSKKPVVRPRSCRHVEEVRSLMEVAAIETLRLELTLNEAMETSYDTIHERPVLIVRVLTREVEGWGECSALLSPTYTEEYLDGAEEVLARELIPRLFAGGVVGSSLAAMAALQVVHGHHMAKAGLEMALLDAELREHGRSLGEHIGADALSIPGGVNLGIDEPERVVERAGAAVAAGYTRIKCKIAPGRDLGILSAISSAYPEVVLSADANGAYRLADEEHITIFRQLDEIGLSAFEQPLAKGAWQDHATLARMLDTPVVLDESIASLGDLDLALAFGSADGISIKAARLGGVQSSLPVIERAREAGLSLCIGGMYETGIGRSAALALGALGGFDLPGDLGASDRYYAPDITEAHLLVNGCLAVPRTVGIGRVPSPGALARFAVRRRTFLPS